MALQLYTNALIYVDGTLLAEAQQLTVDRETNAQNLLTIAKGFAGLSPGAPMCMISFENAVPSASFELNPGPFMAKLVVKEISIFAAGSTLTTKGFFVSDNFGYAVNSESKLSAKLVCEFADWK